MNLPLPACALLVLVTSALYSTSAHAVGDGKMQVTASQNTVGSETDTQPISAGLIQADFGTGHATASLLQLTADADGAGDEVTRHFSGSAVLKSSYTLWNLLENRALGGAEASPLVLGFDFEVRGWLTVPSTPDVGVRNTASASFAASVFSGSDWAQLTGSHQVAWHAASDYIVNSALEASGAAPQTQAGHWFMGVDGAAWLDFTLVHDGSATGQLNTSLAALGATGGTVEGLTLTLTGVHLLDGSYSDLGVRFNEPGTVLAVTAVPEPATSALLLAGVAGLMWRRRQGG